MRVFLAAVLAVMLSPQSPTGKVILSLDLAIQETDGILFGQLADLAANSKNMLYVIDSGEKTIYKYSEEGRFLRRLGRSGQGPGEFQKPRSVYIDAKDFIYVLDSSNRRIEVFDSNDEYLRSIKILTFPTGNSMSLTVGDNGEFYISGYYPNDDTVLCQFSPKGDLVKKFPLPIIEYTDLTLSDHSQRMVNQYLVGGSLCVSHSGLMFFSYDWPYRIVVLEGDAMEPLPLRQEEAVNWTPFIFRTNQVNGMLFGGFTRALKIFSFGRTHIIHSILAFDWEGDPRRTIDVSIAERDPGKYFKVKGKFAVLHFYTETAKPAGSARVNGDVRFLGSDAKGRLLGIRLDNDDMPIILRYTVSGLL